MSYLENLTVNADFSAFAEELKETLEIEIEPGMQEYDGDTLNSIFSELELENGAFEFDEVDFSGYAVELKTVEELKNFVQSIEDIRDESLDTDFIGEFIQETGEAPTAPYGYEVYENVPDYDFGEMMVDSLGFLDNVPSEIASYFDYEQFGHDCKMDYEETENYIYREN